MLHNENDVQERLFKERELLQQKLALAQEFHRLTELQQSALSGEDMDQLNELVAKRQGVIEKINILDNEITLLHNHAGTENLYLTPDDDLARELAGETADLREKIQGCLQMAYELNQKIRNGMEKSLKDVMYSIGTLRVTRQTENAYSNKKHQVQGFFVDKKK